MPMVTEKERMVEKMSWEIFQDILNMKKGELLEIVLKDEKIAIRRED